MARFRCEIRAHVHTAKDKAVIPCNRVLTGFPHRRTTFLRIRIRKISILRSRHFLQGNADNSFLKSPVRDTTQRIQLYIVPALGARFKKCFGFAHLPFGSVCQPGTIPLGNLMSSSSNNGCRAVVSSGGQSVQHGRCEARLWASLRPALSFRVRAAFESPYLPENFTIIPGGRGMLISSASILFLQIFPSAHSILHAGENRKHHR